MFVLIKGNGPAVYLAVYLTAGSNKQLSLVSYYCPPRWRLRANINKYPTPRFKPYLYVQKYWILNTETHKISQHAFSDQQVTNGYEL